MISEDRSEDRVILLDERTAIDLVLETLEYIHRAKRDCAKAFAYLKSIDSAHLKEGPLSEAKCELDNRPSDSCAAAYRENCFSVWLCAQKLTRICDAYKEWGGFIFEYGEQRFINQMFPSYPQEARDAMCLDLEKRMDELRSRLKDSDLSGIEL